MPSLSTAIETVRSSSRAWPPSIRFSTRSSIQRTERPSSPAAAIERDVLACDRSLRPEPATDVVGDHVGVVVPTQEAEADQVRVLEERLVGLELALHAVVVLRLEALGVGGEELLGAADELRPTLLVRDDLLGGAAGSPFAGERRSDPPERVARLGGVADRHVSRLGVDLDHAAAGLHRLVRLARARQAFGDHPVGRGEDRVDVGGRRRVSGCRGERVDVVVEDVAVRLLPQLRLVGSEPFGDRRDRVERVVVDVDQFDRVLREVARLGDHDRDRVADHPDRVLAQCVVERRVEVRHHRERRERMGDLLDVGAGEDGDDTRRGFGRTDVDRRDPSVCHRAAEEHRLEHVVGHDVGDVSTVAGEQAIVFDPLDALADEAGPVGGSWLGDGHDASPLRLGLHDLDGAFDPGDDRLVAGAPAEVAAQFLADLGGGRDRGSPRGARRRSSGIPGNRTRTGSRGRPSSPAGSGASEPSGCASPSMVVISAPSACPANIRHERAGSPSTSTVHAPHTPCSQPRWVPVSPTSSRITSLNVRRASTVTCCAVPLTVKPTLMTLPPAVRSASSRVLFDESLMRVLRSWPPRRRGRGGSGCRRDVCGRGCLRGCRRAG